MTAEELRRNCDRLGLHSKSKVLDVGSGSGGPAIYISEHVKCRVLGIDINDNGIKNANGLARTRKMEHLVEFRKIDAGAPLPFDNNEFDAILSNDAMAHIPRRAQLLKDWFRILKPGSRILYTDAMIIN